MNVTTNGHHHGVRERWPTAGLNGGRHSRERQQPEQLDLLPAPDAPDLPAVLESLLFVATEPVEVSTLARSLGVRPTVLERAARELSDRLRVGGLRLQRTQTCMQLVTAPEWSQHVERFLGVAAEQPLSPAALETLAIVAYRQPVTRTTIEGIRGVNAERALATLRSRCLVDEVGRSDSVGRPLLFGTTMQFLEHFGLESLGELPPLPEASLEAINA